MFHRLKHVLQAHELSAFLQGNVSCFGTFFNNIAPESKRLKAISIVNVQH